MAGSSGACRQRGKARLAPGRREMGCSCYSGPIGGGGTSGGGPRRQRDDVEGENATVLRGQLSYCAIGNYTTLRGSSTCYGDAIYGGAGMQKGARERCNYGGR